MSASARVIDTILRIGQYSDRPKLEHQLVDEKNDPIPLEDATAVTITTRNQTFNDIGVAGAEVTITNAPEGRVEYLFDPADVALSGRYEVQFEIERDDGTTELYPPNGMLAVDVINRLANGRTPLLASRVDADEVTTRYLQATEAVIGEDGLRGLSPDPIKWFTGAGLTTDENGRVNVTTETYDEVVGLTNPLTGPLNANNQPIHTLPSPTEPDHPARLAETSSNAEDISALETNKADQTAVDDLSTSKADQTAVDDLDTRKADQSGDTIDPARLSNIRVIAPSVEGCFDTLAEALADLPNSGGVIYLAETCTETADITIDTPVQIIGQGSQWATPVPAHINLGNNTIHYTYLGAGIQQMKFVGGNILIGEHGSNLGRHHFDFQMQNPNGGAVEFRGGHMECKYNISVNGAAGDSFVWNLDSDSASDYFNDNRCVLTASGCDGDGFVMTGIGMSTWDLHGNEFRDLRAEQITGTAWRVDGYVNMKANPFSGFGIHDGGVDVTPAVAENNTIDFSRLKGGGQLNIGGRVRAPKDRRDAMTLGPNTAFWDMANGGGMTKQTAAAKTTHAGHDVTVAGNSWQTIFSRANPVTIECGTIVGHNVEQVRVTWSDGSQNTIYRNTARAQTQGGDYISVKSLPRIQNVTELEFKNNAGSNFNYGWDVTVSEY